MVKRFRKKPKESAPARVRQRWQLESAFSATSGGSVTVQGSRERKCRLRFLTHNLLLLAAIG